MKLSILFLIGILITLNSCSKEDSASTTTPDKVLNSKVIEDKNASNKRLLYYTKISTDPSKINEKDSTVYVYNSKNKIIKETHYYIIIRENNLGIKGNIHEINYSYGNLERIEKVTNSYYNIVDNLKTKSDIVEYINYEENGYIKKTTSPLDSNGHPTDPYESYLWDSNNNIIKVTRTSDEFTFTYDDKRNYKNSIYPTGWLWAYYEFGGNNNLKERFVDGTLESYNLYEYNSEKLPIKMTSKIIKFPYETITHFFYE